MSGSEEAGGAGEESGDGDCKTDRGTEDLLEMPETVSSECRSVQLRWAVVCDRDLQEYISAEDRR